MGRRNLRPACIGQPPSAGPLRARDAARIPQCAQPRSTEGPPSIPSPVRAMARAEEQGETRGSEALSSVMPFGE